MEEVDARLLYDCDKMLCKKYPYLKYLVVKSGMNTQGLNKLVTIFPEHYIDYLMIDIESQRVSKMILGYVNDDSEANINIRDNRAIEITFDDYNDICMSYLFYITDEIYNSINNRAEYFFGKAIKVKPEFKLIKGGKK